MMGFYTEQRPSLPRLRDSGRYKLLKDSGKPIKTVYQINFWSSDINIKERTMLVELSDA